MMILTNLLLPTITILARKWPNGRRVFLPTNETLEGNCLAISIVGNFLKRSYEFSLYLKPFCKQLLNLVLSLFMNMSAK